MPVAMISIGLSMQSEFSRAAVDVLSSAQSNLSKQIRALYPTSRQTTCQK
jgi:hypothetical protein